MRTANLLTAASAPTAMAVAAQQQHSAWHSPVPYLFGGLAAMLGLIAFALLILACSYWKLSGYLEGDSDGSGGRGDLESGDGKPRDAGAARALPLPLELGVVVIMAGGEKPTHLATPMSSRASSFGNNNKEGRERLEEDEKKKAAVEAAGHGSSPATPGPHRQLQEGAHGNGDRESHHSHEDERPTPEEEETHHSADRNQL